MTETTQMALPLEPEHRPALPEEAAAEVISCMADLLLQVVTDGEPEEVEDEQDS